MLAGEGRCVQGGTYVEEEVVEGSEEIFCRIFGSL